MDNGAERPRAYIYTRVSSKEQVDGFSLETQEKICRQYAARSGYAVDRVFVERGESAKTANRTQLQIMLKCMALNKKSISALIVYKVDRLARDSGDYGDLVATMKRLGIQVCSTVESLEDTPWGHFHGNIAASIAQLDNEERAVRCKNGMIAAVEAGRYCWQAPLGYVNGGNKNCSSLQLGEASTVELVRKSFELIDSGCSVSEALRLVTEQGLRARTGRKLSRNTFRTMLQNKTYIGLIESFGKTTRGDFEPLVSEDVFYRVQLVLHRRAGSPAIVYQKNNPKFPLRGLALCPNCGRTVTGSESKGNGGKYAYYWCPHCRKFSVRAEKLEGAFGQLLSSMSLKTDYAKLLEIAIDANLEGQRSWIKKETAAVERELQDLKTRRAAIVDKTIKGVIPDNTARELLFDMTAHEEELKAKRALASESALITSDVVKNGLGILQQMGTFWDTSDLSTKQQFQKFVFPEGVAILDSGFRTTRTASCLQPRRLPLSTKNTVVGPPGFEPRTKRL